MCEKCQEQVKVIAAVLKPHDAEDFAAHFATAQGAQKTQDGRRAVQNAVSAFVLSKVGKQIMKAAAKHLDSMEKNKVMQNMLRGYPSRSAR